MMKIILVLVAACSALCVILVREFSAPAHSTPLATSSRGIDRQEDPTSRSSALLSRSSPEEKTAPLGASAAQKSDSVTKSERPRSPLARRSPGLRPKKSKNYRGVTQVVKNKNWDFSITMFDGSAYDDIPVAQLRSLYMKETDPYKANQIEVALVDHYLNGRTPEINDVLIYKLFQRPSRISTGHRGSILVYYLFYSLHDNEFQRVLEYYHQHADLGLKENIVDECLALENLDKFAGKLVDRHPAFPLQGGTSAYLRIASRRRAIVVEFLENLNETDANLTKYIQDALKKLKKK